MTRSTFADELQDASDRIADVPRADLQIMLRRAALMIRNIDGIDLDPRVEDSLSDIAVEMELSMIPLTISFGTKRAKDQMLRWATAMVLPSSSISATREVTVASSGGAKVRSLLA